MANVSSSNGLEKRPKLRFPGFDEPWKKCEFKEFAEVNPKCQSIPEQFYYIDLGSVEDGELRNEKIENALSAPSRAQRLLSCNDVLFQTVRPYQQNNYLFCEERSLPTVASTGYAVFRTKYDVLFLYALIHTGHFLNSVLSRCTGTSFPAVSASDIEDILVSIPSLGEQQKIGELFRLLNSKIRKQKALIEALKKYKRGVVKAIMTKQIRFVDKNGKPYPEWSACTLQDAVDFLDGQRKPLESADRAKRQGKYPYYGASGIIDSIDDYIFDEPLILLGEDGANIINRSSPLCFIATGKYWVNNHAHVMRPHKGQNIRFLRELLESLDYTRYNTGTAQPKLNQEKCRTIPLSLPIYEEQCHIADFLAALEHKCAQENEELEGILQTKNALMQQLFI